MTVRPVTVQLPDDERDELDDLAKHFETSRHSLMRVAIHREIARLRGRRDKGLKYR